MNKKNLIIIIVVFVIVTGLAVWYASIQPAGEIGDNGGVALANPASENCVQKGGTLEMRNSKQGQYGVCLFEDNRQCEEWALLRGQCPVGGLKITGYENDAQIYCAITGGQVEGVGTATPMCKRTDGTYCSAQANLDGECPDPNNPNPNSGNVEVP
jgi:putative hemolysin